MRFTISGATAALLLASMAPAGAQSPMPPPPPPMAPPMVMGDIWQGLYAGANFGGLFGSSTGTLTTGGGTTFTTNNHLDGGGALGGGQIGYNFRLNPSWILGLETDFDGAGLSNNGGTGTRTIGGLTSTYQVGRTQEWLGTVRGRLGWTPSPTWLYYVTGGFAYAQIDSSFANQFSGTSTAAFRGSKSGVETGWTVGTGAEYAVSPQFSIKAEYLYVDLGSLGYNARNQTVGSALTNHISIDNNENIFRVGLNYHFNQPPPPPPPVAYVPPPPAAPKVFIVFFDWDKDTITPEGHAIIQQAADAYKAGAPVQIQVTGYTDRSGSPGYNQRLSERRANNVARAMAALGVPKDQMIVAGRGENDNRVPTAPGVREPQNRRVEIVEP
jgi:outer membrane protein OmpA-like peptidoglycan-associated protein